MTTWASALERYEQHAAVQVAPATLRARMGRLRRLGREIGAEPGAVTAARFAQWVEGLTCSLGVTGEYVQAARAFYRWAVGAGLADESPIPAPTPGRRYALDARWLDAVHAFGRAQAARGIAPGTTRRRLQHVRRFAATIGTSPWHVTQDDYLVWAGTLERSESVTAAQRDSLRAFYRWAHATGRIAADPTIEPEQRRGAGAVRVGPGQALGVPAQWAEALGAWRRWMIGAGLATTTVESRYGQLETFARAHASADPFTLTPDDVFDWMAGHTWARETRRGKRQTLRHFYRWAHATGRADTDPTESMPRVRAGDVAARPATDDEYAAALAASDDPRWTLALRMGAELGMRRSEVARAHAADMRPEAGGWWLTVHGKGDKVRRVPVPDPLAHAIRQRGTGYLFPNRDGGHITPRHVGKRVALLLPPGVAMHTLRHRFATRAYGVNHDVFTVQRLLGHASAATTQRYVQVSDARMRALVEGIADS
ncbi:tyrosine-type recombinase/integrase [uncultured Microbacterium sp.]|uniref:tyrosine-type recombinase/integrase n=1 Tax=uncultured Microbacterium sp. TaxID=191216 RepID=UPI0025F2E046|nr:tyrosine-type recombinase/integrase [uncultured Microbacterium sp.]